MQPRSNSGEAISASCSFLIATAETTLSLSSCSISSKSVVTSSAANGSNFSIWIRSISGNSVGSMLGRRNRWASTAETGKPRTKSSVTPSSGTASSRVCSLRTFHEPFCSAERRKFQPCPVGIMKIDGVPGSILTLLPAEYLRATSRDRSSQSSCAPKWCHRLERYHLYRARYLTGFSYTHDAHERAFILKER